MATVMFSELEWKKSSSFNKKVYAWQSVESCSDYKYIQNFQTTADFKVVMHSCK